MRIGTRGTIEVLNRNIARPSDRMTRLFSQLTSGKRLEKLSDDPLAAMRAVRSQASLNEITARKYVLQQGEQLVGAADTALGEVADSLRECKSIALQGCTPQLGDDERAALAQQVRDLSTGMVMVANTEVQGQYIFSGSKTDTVPFDLDPSGNLPVAYDGNHQQLSYAINAYDRMPVGFTGAQVFNYPDATGVRPLSDVSRDTFSLLNDLADCIESGDVTQVGTLSTELDNTYSHVVGLRGQVGVMTQRYERATSLADEAEVRVKALLNTDRDIDYASAMVDLSQQQTVYQAALSVTSKVLEMPDLFDMSW